MLLSGIQFGLWDYAPIGLLESRRKHAGMTSHKVRYNRGTFG
ncbi:hypothetical protein GPROT1_01067 [Gammaproteobacteria bacterium]|nr:hypothetical protein GPROT1_01067 [Gammaproteobacteria bacterium]